MRSSLSQNITECTEDNCECTNEGHTYLNYYKTHYLKPNEKYLFFIQEWKHQFKKIHEDCVSLGINGYSDDYVQGVLDATSYEYPSPSTNHDLNDEIFDIPDWLNNQDLKDLEYSTDEWLHNNT